MDDNNISTSELKYINYIKPMIFTAKLRLYSSMNLQSVCCICLFENR